MKNKVVFIWLSAFAVLFNTCEKSQDTDHLDGIENEILSEEEVNFLDNVESVELSFDEVILENGQTVEEYLLINDPEFYNSLHAKSTNAIPHSKVIMTEELLITRMNAVAIKLTDRSKFVYPAGAKTNQPAQHGLAYSYGSKEYHVRKKPSEGHCKEAEVYGLDCAGLIYQLFLQSKVEKSLWTTAENQRQPERLKDNIQHSFPELTDLNIVDKGKIEPSNI